MIKFFLLLLVCGLPTFSYSQVDTLELSVNKLEGLENIILDQTRLAEIEQFKDYVFSKEEHGWNHYSHPQTGITLVTHQLDLNQTIRSVEFAPGKKIVLSNGLILNSSNLTTVEFLLKERNSFSDSPRITHENIRYFFVRRSEKEFILNRIEFLMTKKITDHINYLIDSSFFDSLSNRIIPHIKESLPLKVSIDSIVTILFGKKPFIQDSIHRWINDSVFQIRMSARRTIFSLTLSVLYLKKDGSPLKPLLHDLCLNRDTNFVYTHKYSLEGISLKWHRDANVEATVGYFCSIGGSPPAMMEEVFSCLEKKEPGKLLRLLYSPSPELQAYGFLGIHFYQFRHKWKVSEQVNRRMEAVYSFNPRVEACRGCNFGFYSMQDMVNYADLYPMYKVFRQNGFIR